jgi:hypothetical protein
MNPRKAVVIHEEDFSALTILKPFSEEYLNYLIVISEDAHGEFSGKLMTKTDLKSRLNLSEEEFEEMQNKL